MTPSARPLLALVLALLPAPGLAAQQPAGGPRHAPLLLVRPMPAPAIQPARPLLPAAPAHPLTLRKGEGQHVQPTAPEWNPLKRRRMAMPDLPADSDVDFAF